MSWVVLLATIIISLLLFIVGLIWGRHKTTLLFPLFWLFLMSFHPLFISYEGEANQYELLWEVESFSGLLKNRPDVFGLIAWPLLAFFFAIMISDLTRQFRILLKTEVSLKDLFLRKKGVFQFKDSTQILTRAEVVIGLSQRFLSPLPTVEDIENAAILKGCSSSSLVEIFKRSSQFIYPSDIAEQFNRRERLKIYEDLVSLAVFVECVDDNTMQRIFVSASQAGVRIDEFLNIIDHHQLGDIWDGLTPEEAAAQANSKTHSKARSRSHYRSKQHSSAQHYGENQSNERSRKLAIFGLKATASLKELKKAYRKMAIKYHPDRNAGSPNQVKTATEKMAELNLAYDWLVQNW